MPRSFAQLAREVPLDQLSARLAEQLAREPLDSLPALLARLDEDAAPEGVETLAALERKAIAVALRATGGSVARAAALLGIDRATLHRKLGRRR